MLDLLVTNTETLSEQIIHEIKNFKITDVPGENMNTVVSHLRSHCRNLFNISRLPSDIELLLLQVYQTTSHDPFNEMFAQHEKTLRFSMLDPQYATSELHRFSDLTGDSLSRQQLALHSGCERYNTIAERAYVLLRAKWHLPDNLKAALPARVTIFKATALLSGVCWNCGQEGHLLSNCPKPANKKQIEANRKAFRDAQQRRSGSGSGDSRPSPPAKFAAPTESENNRRVIDGVPMFYNRRTKRWIRDRDASAGSADAHHASSSTPSSVQEGDAASVTSEASKQRVDAALTSTTREFGNLMTKLQRDLQDL